MIAEVSAHFDAKGGNLANVAPRGQLGFLHRLPICAQQASVRGRLIQAHINARRAAHAVAREPESAQGADHAFFQPVHIFLDEITPRPQIQQRIRHHLPRPVVGHLPTPVGLHHGDVSS